MIDGGEEAVPSTTSAVENGTPAAAVCWNIPLDVFPEVYAPMTMPPLPSVTVIAPGLVFATVIP